MRNRKKVITFMLIFAFIYNILPAGIVKAVDNSNILSSTTITCEEAKQWMRGKGATDTFIGLADLYWKYASERGGVNPAIAYVQAAKETGYGKFGGIINESYKNPCGLKTHSGGDDRDANAHQRFNSWDEGVQAHLDHLALYAGASGYPRSTTYDPRHFADLKGKATTVLDLGGKWAPGTSYGSDLMKMYNQIIDSSNNNNNNNNNVASNLVGNIDEPSANQQVSGKTLTVRGWALNPAGIKEINVYVDGKLKGKATLGLGRPDIYNVYKNSYPNTSNSGYKLDVDISSLTAGTKEVKVEEVGNDGTKRIQTKNFDMKKLPSLGRIDEPGEGQSIGQNILKIRGWAIAPSGVKEVKIYVDGKLKGTVVPSTSRPDIKNAFSSYPNAGTSGYELTADIADIAGGSRKLRAEEVANDGSVNISEKSINIAKLAPLGRIDEPSEGKSVGGNSLKVRGWAIAPSGIKEVKIYVDGKLKGTVVPSSSRPDIKNAYSNYPSAETSGYELTADIADIAGGSRQIRAEEVANDGSVNISERTVNIAKLTSLGRIDEPSDSQSITSTSVKVRGWAISSSGVKEIKIYVDGKLKGTVAPKLSRPDIKNAFSNYPKAEISGYELTVDISDIGKGIKVIKTEEISNDGTIASNTTNVKLNLKNGIGNIDEPSDSQLINSDEMLVRGWGTNDISTKEVKVYVDNLLMGNASIGFDRPDIKNAYPTYDANSNSGYKASINIQALSAGKHTIRVDVIGIDGSIVSRYRDFYYKNKGKLIVIDPGHNYGGDNGTYGYSNGVTYCERDMNMSVANKLKDLLEQAGYRVVLTRKITDIEYLAEIPSLRKRAEYANSLKADLFISIHHNAFDKSAHGTEVYYTTQTPDDGFPPQDRDYKLSKSKSLARSIVNNITSKIGTNNRGVKDGDLYVLRNTTMPAVLVECGFIDNPQEAAKLIDSNTQTQIAEAIKDSVVASF